jgi:gliding motility-associated-like protein
MKKIKLLLFLTIWSGLVLAQTPHYCDSVQADFTSSAPACTGEMVQFINSGYASADCTYEWDFGTNAIPATATGESPGLVTYTVSGLKQVSLTVTDIVTGCVSYKNKGIQIYENPTATFNATSVNLCINETTDFTNSGSTGSQWTYTWDFGTDAVPSTSNAENPQGVYYTSSGTKTITLVVSNGNCNESTSMFIDVGETPVVNMSSSAPECTGLGVDFTNLGSSTDCTFSWDFGTGATPATSVLENPTDIIYSTFGSKQVQLTITNTTSGCFASLTDDILIRETPTVTFTNSGDDCLSADFDFTNTGSTASNWTYTWDFGNAANPQSSVAENPSGITYSTSGTKNISLTISDANCSNVTTQNIDVYDTPTADFTSTAPECTGLGIDFTNTGSSTGMSFAWDFGLDATPATSTSENPTDIVFSTAGTKTISLTVTNTVTGCVDMTQKTITINQTPAVSFIDSGDDCLSEAFDFTNTGSTSGDWTYTWDFGEGAIPEASTAENPEGIHYNSSGIKTVQLTISNANCSNAANQLIEVFETPTAEFTSTAPQCTGLTVDFTNTGSSTDVSWAWDFGVDATPATSNNENPTGIIYSSAGTKQVTLTITNNTTGCIDSKIQSITIHQTPDVSFNHTDSLCLSGSYDFVNTGSTGEDWNFIWDFGAGAIPATANAENPTGITYNSSGNKLISFTISNANCSNNATASLYVEETPIADFTSDAPQCTGLPVNFTNIGDSVNVSYEWTFGENGTPANSVEEDPLGIIYSLEGTKEIQLITTNVNSGCTDTIVKTITINQTPDVSFTSTAPVCGNNGVDFQNTGSSGSEWNFTWDFGENAMPTSSTAENPVGIMYSEGGLKTVNLQITDGTCSNTYFGAIQIHEFPEINAGIDTTICADASVQIGTPEIIGYTYQWTPSATLDQGNIAQPTASPEAQITQYKLLVTDAATSCTSLDTIIVSMLPPAIADAGPDLEICFGDSIQIGTALIEGQTYLWTPNSGLIENERPNPVVSPESTLIYTVHTNFAGCDTVRDDVRVIVHPLPDIKATGTNNQDTVETAQGDVAQLLATGGIQYEWLPAESLDNSWIYNPSASPDATTLYTVTGTDVYGCVNSDDVLVLVRIPGLYIPSAFTPNDDGRNDVFYIRSKGTVRFELNVFNRNGALIYHSKSPHEGWDGTVQGTGKKVPTGAYLYQTKGEFSDGEKFNDSGVINLIR